MYEEKDQKNKLSLYLLKKDVVNIVKNDTDSIKIEGVGTFYYKGSNPFAPKWLRFFGSTIDSVKNKFTTSTSSGLLVVQNLACGDEKRSFALAFGMGCHLLNDQAYEERFGLKMVLSLLNPSLMRKLNQKNIGLIPSNSIQQLTKAGSIDDFHLDQDQDMIMTATAKSDDADFGGIISGRDSFLINVPVSIHNLLDFLPKCYDVYKKEKYKENFDWIDKIIQEKDQSILSSLNTELLSKLNSDNLENIWLAIPEIIDKWEEAQGFKYSTCCKSECFDDIDFPRFKNTLNNESITLELLNNKRVFAIDVDGKKMRSYDWRIIKCLYAELSYNGTTYLLNGGVWYNAEVKYFNKVKSEFKKILSQSELIDLNLPEAYAGETEREYNERVPKENSDYYTLDRKCIKLNTQCSQIEVCDLISKDKKLLHLKKYGGSSVLSHLFNQGFVSSETLLFEKESRRLTNDRIDKDDFKIAEEDAFKPSDYKIVFVVMSESPDDEVLNIPFFSKVVFNNVHKKLNAYGYKAYIKKIHQPKDSSPKKIKKKNVK